MTEDYVTIIVGVLLGVSELLSLVDKIKPNGILQILMNVAKALVVQNPTQPQQTNTTTRAIQATDPPAIVNIDNST